MKRIMLLFVASVLFSGMMFAQDYHWADFDYHNYVRPMIVISRVQFNGEFQNRADIEVAAFVGDELRGRSFLFEPYPNSPIAGQYFAYAPCYYDVPGETFTFKAYDHATELEYDICSTQLVGQDDGHGTVEDPIILDFSRTEEPTYGPEYPWAASTAYNGEGMVVAAQIKIDGELVDRGSYEVGAFCGEECRATSGAEGLDDWMDEELGYFAFMNVMGNNGDIINFYLHDLENNCNFAGTCFTTIELENGGELGIDIFGGGIFVLNFVTEQTFTKDIAAFAENGGYYLIASPIGAVNPMEVTNMLENEYDLYYFDQSVSDNLEWVNYKPNYDFNLEPGKGYLYANSANVTLTFRGYPYDGDGEVTLAKVDGANFAGLNLVGNPFAQIAYIDRPFYTLNSAGSEIVLGTGNSVEAMEGIFVIAETDGETMTFSTEDSAKSMSQIVLNVIQDRRAIIDRAIVRFGEGGMLPKFMLKQDNTKVFIPQDGNEFAMVRGTDTGEIPVSFKAAQNGSYTFSINAEALDMSYLHLIDNMIGTDIDLLQTPSYTFNAKTTDYESRFKLVFVCGDADDDNDSFAFYSNGNWIINNDGEATLQVIDVNGRILSSERINGIVSKAIHGAYGVYMLRLINGENVKVQKVVVR